MTMTALATIQHDDEHVRITRWDFEPGQSTGRHVHEYDYIVVPVSDGQTTVITPDGTSTAVPLSVGESYTRRSGAEHEVVNAGTSPLAFVEIELKQPAA